jgi:selenide,water dikinase
VTGLVNPKKVWSNAKAQVGDVLILTKGLGTGTITAALKRSELTEDQMSEALQSMTQINSVLDLLSEEEAAAIHAATDITGFGFLGHAMQMAKASDKAFEVTFSQLPQLEKAQECLEKGFLTKAHRTNAQYVEGQVDLGALSEWQKLLLVDPQTSGGLLLSVDSSQAAQIVLSLKSRFPKVSVIGHVALANGSRVRVEG